MDKKIFQILDENNQPIDFKKLDREICELWGVEYDEKHYAKSKPQNTNWFNFIGWLIDNDYLTYNQMIEHLIEQFVICNDCNKINVLKKNYPKQIQLLDYLFNQQNYKIKIIE